MKSMKKAAQPAGRGRKMAVAGVAATGLAAGAAYLAYRRRRTGDHGMLDEETMLGIASAPPAGSSGADSEMSGGQTPGVQTNAPEPMTESIAELAHGVNDPQ